MMKTVMIATIALTIGCSGCSNEKAKKAKEQAEIKAAMAAHCARIRKLTLKEYTQQYFLHNDTTEKDRLAAKKDWEQCQTGS